MRKGIVLIVWTEHFNKGDFDANDVTTQIEVDGYDWICKHSKLIK